MFFFFRGGGGDDFAIRWERDTWPYLHEILRALHYHARDVSMYPRFLPVGRNWDECSRIVTGLGQVT